MCGRGVVGLWWGVVGVCWGCGGGVVVVWWCGGGVLVVLGLFDGCGCSGWFSWKYGGCGESGKWCKLRNNMMKGRTMKEN